VNSDRPCQKLSMVALLHMSISLRMFDVQVVLKLGFFILDMTGTSYQNPFPLVGL
jgi:hypothetical protein